MPCPVKAGFDGQYEGTWSIADGKLTIVYWQPFRIGTISSVHDFLVTLRQYRQTHTFAWDIELDNDQSHTLIMPADHPHNPGDRWDWVRRPGG
jgi:hypothetical protein